MSVLGEGIYFSLNKKIELRDHKLMNGKGIFATDAIKQGEVIWEDKKVQKRHTIKEMSTWSKEKYEKYIFNAYQVSETEFEGGLEDDGNDIPSDASNYMNHSCDPNTWWESLTLMTARRDIAKDEEICYDYGTSELNETKKIESCLCQTKLCRKKILKDDWKRKELRERYKGHFHPWVNDLIEKEKKDNWSSYILSSDDKLEIIEVINNIHSSMDRGKFEFLSDYLCDEVVVEFPAIKWKTKGIKAWIEGMELRQKDFPPFQNFVTNITVRKGTAKDSALSSSYVLAINVDKEYGGQVFMIVANDDVFTKSSGSWKLQYRSSHVNWAKK